MENWKTILKEEGKAAAAAVLSRLAGLLLGRLLGRTGSGKREPGRRQRKNRQRKKDLPAPDRKAEKAGFPGKTEKFPENKKTGEK